VLTPGELSPAELREAARTGLNGLGVTGLTMKGTVDLGGTDALHVTAVTSINATRYTVDQFYASRDGQTYVVTFSFNVGVTPRARARVHDPVLASWSWKS